jgi:hypothetical protein
MVAKFLRTEPSSERPPLLMGLEFFLANQAFFSLDPPPGKGMIRTP